MPEAVPLEAVTPLSVTVDEVTTTAVVFVPPGPTRVRSRKVIAELDEMLTPLVEVVDPDREAKSVPYPPRTVRLAADVRLKPP